MNTLTDDRIESMRSTVMHAVDAEVARRGTRVRRTIGLAAASVLVIGGAAYAVDQHAGSNPHYRSISEKYSGSSSSSGDGQLDSGDAGGKAAVPERTGLDSYKPIPPISKEPASRQVVVTGTANVTVKEPKAVAQKLSSYIESIGGRIDERTQNNDSGGGSAFLKVRVPSGKVTATIAHLKTYGTVENVSLENTDVTTKTTDLGARVRALRLSIARLEAIMGDADTSSELINAESALTERQSQLDSMQTQLSNLSSQVQLSTLSIDLSQKPKADAVSPGGFHGGLVDGWNAMVATANHVVKAVGILLPWAAIVVVLYGTYVLVRRRRRA